MGVLLFWFCGLWVGGFYWKCCLMSLRDRGVMPFWVSVFSAFSRSLTRRTKANFPSMCTAEE